MSDLLCDQFVRMLGGLTINDPWPDLLKSGFLDLLRTEADGGAEAQLDILFPLAVELGRRPLAPPVLATMAARMVQPDAIAVDDPEAIVGRPLAALLATGQMTGAIEALLAHTLDHAQVRQQFGRSVGSFQAVQGQIAILAEEAAAARIAAAAAFQGSPFEICEPRVAAAKIRCGQAAGRAAAIAHAVHGAIGISEEHVLHHHARDLRRWRLAHGGESWWARRLGDWVFARDDDMVSLVRALSAGDVSGPRADS